LERLFVSADGSLTELLELAEFSASFIKEKHITSKTALSNGSLPKDMLNDDSELYALRLGKRLEDIEAADLEAV